MFRRKTIGTPLLVLGLVLGVSAVQASQPPLWTSQFGSSGFDVTISLDVGTGQDVYAFGFTENDVFLRKFDRDGDEVWTREFGTPEIENAGGTAVDSQGNVYVSGRTDGILPGQVSAGGADAFVRKYDSDGNELWTRQFGTPAFDQGLGMASDRLDAVYVAGRTRGALPGQVSVGNEDAFIRKYDSDGNELWTRQFGTTAGDMVFGVVVDATGDVYLGGRTDGTLPGQVSAGVLDAFVRKYDPDGNELWTRQFGSSGRDNSRFIALDPKGNIYAGGRTSGALPGQVSAGGRDAFVRKYDSDGNELWTRQFGTAAFDGVRGVAADSMGNVFVAGGTRGAFPGQVSAGDLDMYVRKYDRDGNVVWTRQFGTPEADVQSSGGGGGVDLLAVDSTGSVYVGGLTLGTLTGQDPNAGSADAFVRKYDRFGNTD